MVAIISGGIDSSTMLYDLFTQGYDIKETITFNYGQRHVKELQAAERLVQEFNARWGVSVEHRVVDIGSIGELIATGALTGDAEVPKHEYDADTQKVTVVPNRNGIFLNIAAGRAVTIKAEFIAYAAHNSDYNVYPDCRPEYIEAMDNAIALGNLWDTVHIIAPYSQISKSQIVKRGIELEVPYEHTWSCYEGNERPCLACGTCIERTKAFYDNGTKDPALTDEEWAVAVDNMQQ